MGFFFNLCWGLILWPHTCYMLLYIQATCYSTAKLHSWPQEFTCFTISQPFGKGQIKRLFSVVQSTGFNVRHSLAWFYRLLATFLIAEIKCQASSSLKNKKGFILVGGRGGTGAGGAGKGEREWERMRSIDAQYFLLFIQFGDPGSYSGSSELVFPLPFWKYHHRHTQNLVSGVTGNAVNEGWP